MVTFLNFGTMWKSTNVRTNSIVLTTALLKPIIASSGDNKDGRLVTLHHIHQIKSF
jgi:hypothetical protein